MTGRITQEAVDFNGVTIGYLVRGSLDLPQLAWIAEPAGLSRDARAPVHGVS